MGNYFAFLQHYKFVTDDELLDRRIKRLNEMKSQRVKFYQTFQFYFLLGVACLVALAVYILSTY